MSKGLGAVGDDPWAIYARAVQLGNEGLELPLKSRNRRLRFREAAELGWLACSSMADVVSRHLGLKVPGGFAGRNSVYTKLAAESGMSANKLGRQFVAIQEVLHGECFHGNTSCEAIPALLDSLVRPLLQDSEIAVSWLPRRGR